MIEGLLRPSHLLLIFIMALFVFGLQHESRSFELFPQLAEML